MSGSRLILTALVLVVAAATAEAGLFSRGKAKADPEKGKQLAAVLRSDPDDGKRREAAAALADQDPQSTTDLLAALIGALQRDRSAGVRAEAAATLGTVKPFSPQGGLALERAAQGDADAGVRDAAKAALWEYHLNGYRSQKAANIVAFQTAEPPLARPRPAVFLAAARPAVLKEPMPAARVPVQKLPTGPVPTLLPPVAPPPAGEPPFAGVRPPAPALLPARRPPAPTDEPPLFRPVSRPSARDAVVPPPPRVELPLIPVAPLGVPTLAPPPGR